MAQNLNPFSGRQFLDANGDPYVGAQLFTYVAGSTTKATTTKDSAGASNHANPIILNSRGEPGDGSGASQAIWQAEGVSIKLVLAPSTDTDPPVSAISTWDNLDGVNDLAAAGQDQWISGPTPTYVSADTFTLVGDQTTEFHVGRRLKTTNSGGDIYCLITASAYTSLTTITVVTDTGSLDSGLSSVSYGLLSAVNPSVPGDLNKIRKLVLSGLESNAEGANIASATDCNIWANEDGNTVHLTGTTPVTDWGTATQSGAYMYIICDAATPLTYHATTNDLTGGIDYTTSAGDILLVYARSTASYKVTIIPYDGLSVVRLINGTTFTTTSGTSYDFTGIPSWVKRITLMFSATSTTTASQQIIQIGDAGGFEATGYGGAVSLISAGASSEAHSTGFFLNTSAGTGAVTSLVGSLTLSLLDSATNRWAASGVLAKGDAAATIAIGGVKALSAPLTQVRLTTRGGTDTFDGGLFNIIYE